jgi:hypothetical protein
LSAGGAASSAASAASSTATSGRSIAKRNSPATATTTNFSDCSASRISEAEQSGDGDDDEFFGLFRFANSGIVRTIGSRPLRTRCHAA